MMECSWNVEVCWNVTEGGHIHADTAYRGLIRSQLNRRIRYLMSFFRSFFLSVFLSVSLIDISSCVDSTLYKYYLFVSV